MLCMNLDTYSIYNLQDYAAKQAPVEKSAPSPRTVESYSLLADATKRSFHFSPDAWEEQ